MSKIVDRKVKDFLEELASKTPTPGGGAVAALAGSLAASLCLMVVNLTRTDTGVKKDRLEKLQKRLLNLADEDVAAFDAVMAAYRSKDKTKIQKALKKATEVPLETAELSLKTKKIAGILTKKGNKNAYSDARSAYYLAEAARKSALENVKINVKYITDEKWKEKTLLSVTSLR